jgi:protein-glutamine gamma-glutamyltransferase
VRFSSLHKVTTYLMVCSAAASLWLSPDVSMLAVLLSAAGILLSFFFEPSPRTSSGRVQAAWNIATLAFLLYLIAEVLQGESPLLGGVLFLLFVLVNKLFNRHSSRDYRQIYVVSFLILVAATTLNTDLSYALCFVAYVVFATWTLTLFHLRREMEDNYLLKHQDGVQSEKVEVERVLNSRRIVGGAFLAGTSLVSLVVLLVTSLIFVLFPRVGFGLFLGHRRAGVAMVGFQERVELGHHGVVRDNPQVVMRIVFPAGRPTVPLRFRGSVYDAYEAGVWSHNEEFAGQTWRVDPQGGLYLLNPAPGVQRPLTPRLVRAEMLGQEIYLEPLDSTVIFAADRPVALEVPSPVLGKEPFFVPRRGPLGEVRGEKMRTAGVKYTAYSHVAPAPRELLATSAPLATQELAPFLQLPPRLPYRVAELARRITAGRRTVLEKVLAVQDHLRRSYAYTLSLTHDPRLEPLDEFLFVTRRGHCEYFASAMAILLRVVGIHTRQVNGFAAGEWNELGKYLAVRQGDAHAWVEVLFSKVGWVTFDPTPPATGFPASGGLARFLGQALDTLRLRWFRYVVEYDLSKQVALFSEAGRLFRRGLVPRWSLADSRRPLAIAAGVVVALGLLVLVALRLRRRRARGGGAGEAARAPKAATVLYARLLRLLAREGHAKPSGATPGEFVLALAAAGVGAAPAVERFTDLYYRARFGLSPPVEDELRSLARLFAQIEGEVRASRRRGLGPR